jgi:hypothetical protein
MRYALMARVWDPVAEDQAPERRLGWQPGQFNAKEEAEIILEGLEGGPLGEFS